MHGRSLRNIREGGLWAGVLAVCVAGPFSAMTVVRNAEWGDPFQLWGAAERLSPYKLRVLYNFGTACLQRKDYEKAETAFSKAITAGELKAEKGLFRPDEGVEVKCFHLAYANLASIYLTRYMKGDRSDAGLTVNRVDEIYKRGMERTAYDPDLALMYAQFLLQLGRSSDSTAVLTRSLQHHNWADHLYYALGMSCLDIGDLERAELNLMRATEVREFNAVGVHWELPRERQAEMYSYLGLAQFLRKNRATAKESFRRAFEYDVRGIYMLLTTTMRTRNSKLRAIKYDPPDLFLTALSETRRDLLILLGESLDAAYAGKAETMSTTVKMFKDAMVSELARREQAQKKRLEFGFTDDLDKID